jgi:hypothetical protein
VRHLIRFAVQLYPRRWRARYGHEFETLLGDLDADWGAFVNILQGALVMRVRMAAVPLGCGLAGALIGAFVATRMPADYESMTTVRLHQAGPASDESLRKSLEAAFSEASLSALIKEANLYDDIRVEGRAVEDEAVLRLRRAIHVDILGQNQDSTVTTLRVGFAHPDGPKAQQVTAKLVSLWSSTGSRPSLLTTRVEQIDPPSQPTLARNRHLLLTTGTGLTLGLLAGAIIGWLRSQSPRTA